MNEYTFKVIVIGDPGVGKTSTIKRYVHNEFSNKYKYTIGVDFALKQVEWNSNTIVRLQLWDIGGQERFSVMTHVYYKEAVAACIVFDLTSPKTFEALLRWKEDVDLKVHLPNGEPVPCILLANKSDLPHTYDYAELTEYSRKHGYIGCYPISAKQGQGIDHGMAMLIESIINAMSRMSGAEPPPSPLKDQALVNLNEQQNETKSHKKCCVT